jgi:hypothetical protein
MREFRKLYTDRELWTTSIWSVHDLHGVPILQEAGWAPGPGWTCAKNFALNGIFFFGTIVDLLTVFDLFVERVTNMGQIILLPLPKEGML